jgi:hypothetical protein
MKIHAITILVISIIAAIAYYVLISPTLLAFIILIAILVLFSLGFIKLYKLIYQSAKNIFGNE